MPFVSYAQNFEDVMLWRALKHVKNGFYIDIGAQDPFVDSVSLAFYEHGWRGIHVEPTQQYSQKLRVARPDETVLQVAIGNEIGTLTFYEFEDTGLSTADIEIAQAHQKAGRVCKESSIPVISLDSLLDRVKGQEVHWLKLDVEGLEKAVLTSWKTSSVLPWILAIESAQPLTQTESHADWEHLLLDKGYKFVYWDGLNRFYVSPHHAEFANSFRAPPNVFDGFVLSGIASHSFCKSVEAKALQAEAKALQADAKALQAEAKAQQAEAALAYQSRQLCAVYQSKSWRITKPLRWIARQKRLMQERGLRSRGKSLIIVFLKRFTQTIKSRPRLKRAVLNVLNRLPRLKFYLMRINNNMPPLGERQLVPMPDEVEQLSPHARHMRVRLKAASPPSSLTKEVR